MILLILALIALANCTLKIVQPTTSSFPNNEIQYGIANFGDIPYGKTVSGVLSKYQVEDLCTIKTPLNDSNAILISYGGNCSYVKKAINAQKVGAKMAIIIDDIAQNQMVIQADDGNGRNVHIPVLFINNQNGTTLLDNMQKKSIKIMTKFKVNKTDVSQIKFWLTASERNSFILIKEFAQYYQKLSTHTTIDIAYFSYPCKGCLETDCYESEVPKTYCLTDLIHSEKGMGRLIIQEQFRQYALFKYDQKQWLKYMELFDNECYNTWNTARQCSYKVMISMNVDASAVLSIKNQLNQIQLLQIWREQIIKGGVSEIPDATVNGINYEGNVQASDIAEMVCASLNQIPSGCSQFFQISQQSSESSSRAGYTVLWVLLSVFIVIVVGILVWIIYKKTVKRQITNQMSSKVTEMVTKYVTLVSEQQKKNKQKQIEISRQDL